jgi:hypothetical protein
MTFTYGEQIAIAIAHAMRNNIEPLKTVLDDLRKNGYDDYTIGQMFMDIGKIVFNENEIIDETEGELQEMKQSAIAGERDKIIAFIAKRICAAGYRGECEHESCEELANLIMMLNVKEHLA